MRYPIAPASQSQNQLHKIADTSSYDNFTFSNKQLSFLQHIYHSLKIGKRIAVVLPDNILFFIRGVSDYDNTNEVCFYDLRTNMPSFGKTNQLTAKTLVQFEKFFDAKKLRAVRDEYFKVFTCQQIADKNILLDLELIREDSFAVFEELSDSIDTAKDIICQLQAIIDLIQSVVYDLKNLQTTEEKTFENLP